MDDSTYVSATLDSILINGFDDELNKFVNVSNNFALTCALFISAELALIANPASGVLTASNDVQIAYFAFVFVALVMHVSCLITAIHSTNWLTRIRTNADWIEFCIEIKLEDVRDYLMVRPLIVGTASGFAGVCLSGCSCFGWEYQTIACTVIGILVVCYSVCFSKISYARLSSFLEQRCSLRADMEPILAIYEDMAKFDELMRGKDNTDSVYKMTHRGDGVWGRGWV